MIVEGGGQVIQIDPVGAQPMARKEQT